MKFQVTLSVWACVLLLTASCGLEKLHRSLPAPTPSPSPTPPPSAGQVVYDTKCSACHALGSYDAFGNPNLSGKSAQVDIRFPTPTSLHNGETLTTQERTDIKAFVSMY